MAFENAKLVVPSLTASGDLSASQHLAVYIDGSGEVAVQTTPGDPVDGVLQDKPTAQGRSASVATAGVSKCVSGGAVTAGQLLAADSAGKVTLAGSGDYAFGRALETVAGADQLVSVLLQGYGNQA
jgi:hypothetical protein